MATPALGRWADWRRASVFVAAGVLTQAGAKWPHDVGLMLSHSLCMRRHMHGAHEQLFTVLRGRGSVYAFWF